ncbi:SDR family NAD(P)-dependent oxidoreductase [Undibacterium sp. LX15W]|uniref:SDR family NAD(P)-dependent oxidoreductase n=2 Tax=Undibacterium flavidum TaxID=2762297 RepID=A0ABR6Y950_9BURK|nr:SDR family NAD(P)-dependent oxidoreductase [Undibacterium flavidum]
MKRKRRILIIGATSSIAEHCARLWIEKSSCDFVFVGRNLERLKIISDDILIRDSQSSIKLITMDFYDPKKIATGIDQIMQEAPVDIVLVAHGSLLAQPECEDNLTTCRDSLLINLISPILFIEACAKHFAVQNSGTLAIIGSVAGDRGRKSNYIYGSAKSGLWRVAQGLQHRFANTKVQITFIKPGPTDTPMTAKLKVNGTKLEPVKNVARQIVLGIDRGDRIIYTPPKWRVIMWVIQHLPSVIFNRLNI